MKASATTKEKAVVKKEGEKKATSEKPHEHKHEHIKHEKAVPQTKPEEKIKQQKTTPTEKSVQTKPAKHKAVRHEKDVPPTKPVKLKNTAKPTGEIPTAATKKTKTAKEKEGVPPVKEAPRHHNLTSAPVRYFQCVFLNGPNGFGLQFPTNLPSNKEEKTHSKTSKRKTRKPGQ
ncbi:PREDICTED: triadin-like [Pygoscelis adeliae]|uniref:triadin-like n=1 Tax=Pygoscelis adeliae TaxID=9238 RepID=UPI0004F4F2E4|nr:PREDICTED: triadin-like [Pygoscelis adeliae]